MSDQHPLRIQIPGTSKFPSVDVETGRITVLLGANGTGKSSLLHAIHAGQLAAQFGQSHTRLVNARRIMQIIGASSLRRAEVNDAVEQVANTLLETTTLNQQHLANEASKLLEALCHRDRRRDIAYAAECDSLARAGQPHNVRPKPLSPLDEFKTLFASALPELELDFDTSAVTLKVRKRGVNSYGPESLSSGEQQVFLLLGKFVFSHSKVVFLIDEPELNLNPRLAERFWSVIERRHPECAFVYATHALHFALRPEVDRALLLTRSRVIPLDGSSEFLELAREDREQFLGSIPSIVLAEKVLFTEGQPTSIDRVLYEYLLQDSSIKVECLGSCEEVEKAIAGRNGWERFTCDAAIAGVIDADYKPHSDAERLRRLNLLVLPYHEAESLLCHPDAVEALSKAMHPPNRQVSATRVVDALCARLAARRVPIALRRAAASFRTPLAPSVSSDDMARIKTDTDAVNAFERAVEDGYSLLRANDPRSAVMKELEQIDRAVADRDIAAMLRLFPGKDLITQILSMLEIKGREQDLLAYYQKHFPSADIPCFARVRDSVKALFTRGTSNAEAG